jgi:hypothetical protein
MPSFQSGPEVGVGGDFHSEGSTKHGGDGANGEGDSAGVVSHPVNADVDDASHDDDEDEDDFVFSIDEGASALLNDGPDLNRVMLVEKLLFLILSFKGGSDVYFSEFAVVVDGPEEADDP